jgi:hypothetical protein
MFNSDKFFCRYYESGVFKVTREIYVQAFLFWAEEGESVVAKDVPFCQQTSNTRDDMPAIVFECLFQPRTWHLIQIGE